jgi:hypothetical protein
MIMGEEDAHVECSLMRRMHTATGAPTSVASAVTED